MTAKEILLECAAKRIIKDKRVSHTERVVALCAELATYFEEGVVDKALLAEAAWLHDVAKDYNDDTHNEPETVKAVIKGYALDTSLDNVTDIIAQHKCKCFAPAKHEIECAILCICDKIDKMQRAIQEKDDQTKNKKAKKAKKKCKKYLTLIKNSGKLSDYIYLTIDQYCSAKLNELEKQL